MVLKHRSFHQDGNKSLLVPLGASSFGNNKRQAPVIFKIIGMWGSSTPHSNTIRANIQWKWWTQPQIRPLPVRILALKNFFLDPKVWVTKFAQGLPYLRLNQLFYFYNPTISPKHQSGSSYHPFQDKSHEANHIVGAKVCLVSTMNIWQF